MFYRYCFLGILTAGFLLFSLTATAKPVQIHCTPLPELIPGQRFGALEYVQGCELSGSSRWLNGLSGLTTLEDGSLLLAVNDRGILLSATPAYAADGSLQALQDAEMTPLPTPEGVSVRNIWHEQPLYDSESIALTCDDAWLVGFERRPRIWRYGETVENMALPEDFPDSRYNKEIESLGLFRQDEAVLFILEDMPGHDRPIPAWLGNGKTWRRLDYIRHGDLLPSDVAIAADGTVYIVERSYGIHPRFDIRIRRTSREEIEQTGRIEGEELFRNSDGWIDNIEGIAVFERDGKRYLLLLSDNNFSRERRTLLLQFRLPGEYTADIPCCGEACALLEKQQTSP